MATYEVFVFCKDCVDVHVMPIRLFLDDGPADKQSIGDVYNGKELPPEVLRLNNNSVQCPKTGRSFYQRDHHQVFLVPIEV
jgi:hypothetical protein